MSATTEKAQKDLIALRATHHPHCIVCGVQNDHGLKLSYQACGDGSVECVFACRRTFQGYGGYLHGGVISSLLDGAMTNCLFARGKIAVTGELTVRFLFPVLVNRKAVVRACVKESRAPLHMTEAKMIQDGRVVVMAAAKFMEVPDANPVAGSV
ncbi:MAG: PaaI family thioesterase [Kiritimatiellae bacterium]|nr:PaaI family thioesterase [Kiritimatiellia bacterium]